MTDTQLSEDEAANPQQLLTRHKSLMELDLFCCLNFVRLVQFYLLIILPFPVEGAPARLPTFTDFSSDMIVKNLALRYFYLSIIVLGAFLPVSGLLNSNFTGETCPWIL